MAAKLNKDLKEKTNIILEIKGIEYNEWLNEKHEEYIKENEKAIWEFAKKGFEQIKEKENVEDPIDKSEELNE